MHISLNEQVGRTVRELRRRRGWNQSELAERMSIHGRRMDPTTVTRMEKGSRPTTAADLESLAAVFNTTPSVIIGGVAAAGRDHAVQERVDLASRAMDAAAEQLGVAHQALNEAGQRAAASVEIYYEAQRELASALDAVDAGQIERLLSSVYATLSHQSALGVMLEGEEP